MTRLVGCGKSFYHCVSRIVGKEMLLTDPEKERFLALLKKVAAFCGIEILSYALMGNHIHIMFVVPEKREYSEEEVTERIRALYGDIQAKDFADALRQYHKDRLETDAAALMLKYTYRMHDLSQFMKTLMQRATMSYNGRHDRTGHLWESRFKSILIEGKKGALETMSAYIELNAVRAGIVEKPEDYRFCSMGAAIGGDKEARKGIEYLTQIMTGQQNSWKATLKTYRKHVYMQAAAHTRKGVTIDRNKIAEVLEAGGKLSLVELLQCRIRYLTDGVVLGGQVFVEDVFREHRNKFGEKRKTGARKPRYGGLGNLYTLRDLRKKPVSISSG
jgi:REP element-mobilizing transposase RayT